MSSGYIRRFHLKNTEFVAETWRLYAMINSIYYFIGQDLTLDSIITLHDTIVKNGVVIVKIGEGDFTTSKFEQLRIRFVRTVEDDLLDIQPCQFI